MMMSVIPRPDNAPPLFGGRTVILFGGVNIEAVRRWQGRVRAAKDVRVHPGHDHHEDGDEPGRRPNRRDDKNGGDQA
jgi:hypothetical protein